MKHTGADALIVALDCEAQQARSLAAVMAGRVRWLKVGMTLFYREGPSIVTELRARGFEIFLDLKLHDIPHQVHGAARAVAGLGARMLTVHGSGGAEMLRAAVDGARAGASDAGVAPPSVLAVTVLTSMDGQTLRSVGVGRSAEAQVSALASLAIESGVDGVVCSPREIRAVRGVIGPDALVVTPGVRPGWASAHDQARIATPASALSAGASHLVIGRPITEDADPAAAASRILEEMESSR